MYAPSPLALPTDHLPRRRWAISRLERLLRTDVGLVKGLTWRRVGYTFLVAMGFALWSASGNWLRFSGDFGCSSCWLTVTRPGGIGDFFLHKGWGSLVVFRVHLLIFFSQLLALTVADNLRIVRVPRGVLLVVALVLGTAAGSGIAMTSGEYGGWPPASGLTWGGLMALVYFKRRRDEELAAALHATQLAHVVLKKKALESRLQVMQAQVEPQFLFNTLQRVGDLYETDHPLADRMLENLILYLRAVLPQMRTSSSTLGQEVQLAEAYLNVERIRLHNRFDVAFDVPAHFASVPFPPMVLLPLIEALSVRGQSGSDYDGALRTRVRGSAGTLELTLAHTGDARPAEDELEKIRNRLAALYGGDGKLEVEPLGPRGTIATLQVPYVAS